jgi:hypothetical protein
MLRTVRATRYVMPLREGGSLPAIVEADDDGLYVLKFRAAGQGPKALIADLLGSELGRALGLPVPEVVLVELDPAIGRNEPDPEIQQLLVESAGLNFGVDFLPGALGFDPLVLSAFSPELAAEVVWFDAFITNVDRTARNPNILIWHREPWLIDHGAAFYFHHSWGNFLARAADAFTSISRHILLSRAGPIPAADASLRPRLTSSLLEEMVALIPAGWLALDQHFSPAEARGAYLAYLHHRTESADAFVEEAERARASRL